MENTNLILKENTIRIESNGIHYETIGEFKNSCFRNVYNEAFLKVQDIVLKNTTEQENEKGISNIITFIGKRGSGKTSAMISFQKALGSKESNYDDFTKDIMKEMECSFICLNCIDGSLLEKGEDIFRIVLAQMLHEINQVEEQGVFFQNEGFNYHKREFLAEVEKIYRSTYELGQKESSCVMDSYIGSLQSLSSSIKVKRDFMDLIDQFNNLMLYCGQNRFDRCSGSTGKNYIVVAVDDLDLNVENGFSMLEQIHRYLLVPNVIVLIALDIEQILRLSVKHFYKMVPEVDSILSWNQDYINHISKEYLDKVLASNYRIYMPDLSYGNRLISEKINIRKENKDIKSALLGKIYRRTGVCFDSQGLKKHFYEPESLRELTNFYLTLESMPHIKVKELYTKNDLSNDDLNGQRNQLVENCGILISDLKNGIVIKKLFDSVDYKRFNQIMKERGGRVNGMVAELLQEVEPEENINKDKEDEKERIELKTSYGQLVEAIYCLGRKQSRKHKPLVHCLLAYLSYYFTEAYLWERIEMQRNDRTKMDKSIMKEIIGDDILDEWMQDLLPKVKISNPLGIEIEEEEDSNSNFVSLAKVKGISIEEVLIDVLMDIKDCSNKKSMVTELIQSMEILFLFLINIKGDRISEGNFKWKMEILTESKIQEDRFNISDGIVKADFSVLNFVGNSLDAVEKLDSFEQALIDALAKKYELEEYKQSFLENSVKNQYVEWEKKYGEYTLPLPVFWLDLTYSLLKRTRRKMKEKNPPYIEKDEMFIYIKELFQDILNQLKHQNEFYHKEQGDGYNMADIFEECPVVKYFMEKGSDNKRKFWTNVFGRMRTSALKGWDGVK